MQSWLGRNPFERFVGAPSRTAFSFSKNDKVDCIGDSICFLVNQYFRFSAWGGREQINSSAARRGSTQGKTIVWDVVLSLCVCVLIHVYKYKSLSLSVYIYIFFFICISCIHTYMYLCADDISRFVRLMLYVDCFNKKDLEVSRMESTL